MGSIFDYYTKKLSAEKLKEVYDKAPERVVQYLNAEIEYVKQFIEPGDRVLELGCGYGRVLKELAVLNCHLHGIDKSIDSIQLAQSYLTGIKNIRLSVMDAVELNLADNSFDLVICIQNGISAFQVDQKNLMREAIRVTRPFGHTLFSSYSEKFWDERLNWFHLQSKAGLLGEIDDSKTKNGNIVCKDGFTATTVTKQDFRCLMDSIEKPYKIIEVDGSSIFCVICK